MVRTGLSHNVYRANLSATNNFPPLFPQTAIQSVHLCKAMNPSTLS